MVCMWMSKDCKHWTVIKESITLCGKSLLQFEWIMWVLSTRYFKRHLLQFKKSSENVVMINRGMLPMTLTVNSNYPSLLFAIQLILNVILLKIRIIKKNLFRTILCDTEEYSEYHWLQATDDLYMLLRLIASAVILYWAYPQDLLCLVGSCCLIFIFRSGRMKVYWILAHQIKVGLQECNLWQHSVPWCDQLRNDCMWQCHGCTICTCCCHQLLKAANKLTKIVKNWQMSMAQQPYTNQPPKFLSPPGHFLPTKHCHQPKFLHSNNMVSKIVMVKVCFCTTCKSTGSQHSGWWQSSTISTHTDSEQWWRFWQM